MGTPELYGSWHLILLTLALAADGGSSTWPKSAGSSTVIASTAYGKACFDHVPSGLIPEAGSSAEVNQDGHWLLPITPTDLARIGPGNEAVDIYQVINQLGLTSATVSSAFIIEDAPLPTVDAITGDDVIHATDLRQGFLISGRGLPGSTIHLEFDSRTVLQSGSTAVVGLDGAWSIPVVQADVIGLDLGQEILRVSQTISGVGFTSEVVAHTFTVEVINLPPTAVALDHTRDSLEETMSTLAAIKVADIAISDDALGSNRTTLAGADAAFFEVVGNELYLRAGTNLDYETKATYALTVSVVDPTAAVSEPLTASYALSITDVNEAPTALNLSALTFDENITAGSQVALLSTVDPDSTTQSFTYALVSGAGSIHNPFFSLSENSLRMTRSPDYESRSTYSIRLRTTDQGGLSFDRNVILDVNDQPDTPTYSFRKSADVVHERGALSIGISTTNLAAGTKVYWTCSGASITSSDFTDGLLSGSVSLGNDGKAFLTKVVAADGVNEVDETLNIKFFSDPGGRQQIGGTITITLRDPLVGEVSDGSDVITGTNANEVITGIPTGSDLRGRGSVDRLTGGGGHDQFLLGDRQGVFYHDGDILSHGSLDIAVITDFGVGDLIVMHGSASLYQLSRGSYSGASGLWIQLLPMPGGMSERIGFVEGATLNNLALANQAQFTYLN